MIIDILIVGLLAVIAYNLITKKKCDCTKNAYDDVWWYGNIDGPTDNSLGDTKINLFIDDKIYKGFNRDGEIIIDIQDEDEYDEFKKWMTLVSFEKLVKHYKKDLKFEVGEDEGTLFGCFPKSSYSDENIKKYVVALSYDGYKI